MNERLVSNSVQIFSLLLGGKTNVNSIIKETGLYKDFVHESLGLMKKAGLISRTRTKKHSQMIFNELTPVGVKIASLKYSVESFNRSYSRLLMSITENLELDSEGMTDAKLKSVLLGRKWNLEEISQYDSWSHESKDFATASLYTFILALCAEYIYLLFYENIVTNKLASAILTQIFTSGVQVRLRHTEIRGKSRVVLIESIRTLVKTNIMKAAELNVLGILREPVTRYVDEYTLKKNNFLNDRFVGSQAREVLNCIDSINPAIGRRTQSR